MNFLGVGLPEMILIFVVALLVFGPRKLPEISRTIAKTVKSLQDASKEFETALSREANELEKTTRAATRRTGRLSAKRRSEAVAPETETTPETETKGSSDILPQANSANADNAEVTQVEVAQVENQEIPEPPQISETQTSDPPDQVNAA